MTTGDMWAPATCEWVVSELIQRRPRAERTHGAIVEQGQPQPLLNQGLHFVTFKVKVRACQRKPPSSGIAQERSRAWRAGVRCLMRSSN